MTEVVNCMLPCVYSYSKYVERVHPAPFGSHHSFPYVVPKWDNAPSTNRNGFVYLGVNPRSHKRHLREAVDFVNEREKEQKIVFIKSWNE